MWNRAVDARHLYAALKLRVTFYDQYTGKDLTSGFGTGFIVGPEGSSYEPIYLVTNRHVVDPSLHPKKLRSAKCGRIEISGHFQPKGDPAPLPLEQSFAITDPE